jgi:hypothetical protein
VLAPADSGPVGFDVAPGDPSAISETAAAHQELADALELHYATIRGAASDVVGLWNGEASSSYQNLARWVADHFNAAAMSARAAHDELVRYGHELERCQREGREAMHNAEWWLHQQSMWRTRYNHTTAEVDRLRQQLQTASAAPGNNSQWVQSLSFSLDNAITQQQTANQHLDLSIQQVLKWQQKGRQAWDDAVSAAGRLNGELGTINVAPPPLAGWARPDQYLAAAERWKNGDGGGLGGFFSGVADWAWDRIKGGFHGALAAADSQNPGSATPLGVLLGGVAGATDHTVGVCVGVSAATGMGRGVGGQVCVEGTPNGGDAVALTGEIGPSTPGASAYVGGIVSNGKVPAAQEGVFGEAGGSVGSGPSVGAAGALGSYRGSTIWDAEGTVGFSAQPEAGVHGGVSDTVVVP